MKRLITAIAAPILLAVGAVPVVAGPAAADTPGCVTRKEFRAVTVDPFGGMRIRRVHKIFDTWGRQTFISDWSGPSKNWRNQQRMYAVCENNDGYVLVAYTQEQGDPWTATWKMANWDGK